eukprot:3298080-Pleurochrysis_carterae.AAC.6
MRKRERSTRLQKEKSIDLFCHPCTSSSPLCPMPRDVAQSTKHGRAIRREARPEAGWDCDHRTHARRPVDALLRLRPDGGDFKKCFQPPLSRCR